jgi:hypothetical protein
VYRLPKKSHPPPTFQSPPLQTSNAKGVYQMTTNEILIGLEALITGFFFGWLWKDICKEWRKKK